MSRSPPSPASSNRLTVSRELRRPPPSNPELGLGPFWRGESGHVAAVWANVREAQRRRCLWALRWQVEADHELRSCQADRIGIRGPVPPPDARTGRTGGKTGRRLRRRAPGWGSGAQVPHLAARHPHLTGSGQLHVTAFVESLTQVCVLQRRSALAHVQLQRADSVGQTARLTVSVRAFGWAIIVSP